jgi:flagellar FliL protein
VTVISLASGYILFAPDEFPKPFRLTYFPTNQNPGAVTSTPAVTPTPTEVVYQPGGGIMVNMATKIINLADTTTSRKYIRLTMVLEFAPDNPAYPSMTAEEQKTYLTNFETKIAKLMPVMDDVVITLLSTKTFEDLYTASGKEALRKELISDITKRVTDYTLISVYFTEFVVQ